MKYCEHKDDAEQLSLICIKISQNYVSLKNCGRRRRRRRRNLDYYVSLSATFVTGETKIAGALNDVNWNLGEGCL